jgi:hypothetical protein
MAKFPSQRKLLYQTGALSNDTYTLLTSGGVSGDLNLPKDLSLLNRRGYASTTRKGVPLVYQCKVDFYLHDEDGQGPSSALNADLQATLKMDGVQNNWVTRNAAVKWHAARETMLKAAGITKRQLGAYAHEIRYNYDANEDAWLVPIDGDGDAFTGGTWDDTKFVTEADPEFSLMLVGTGTDEDAAINTSVINYAYSYLSSRSTVPADSNLESTETPAVNSILRQIDNMAGGPSRPEQSYIETDVKGQGDNPPYDEFASADTNHDITEPVELGRAIAGFGNAYGSMIVEIPFGLAKMRATVFDAADTNVTPSGLVCVEVLDIYEMQG